MRHRQIEQDTGNCIGVFAKHFDRLATVECREDSKAQVFEHLLAYRADRLLIIRDQDGFSSRSIFYHCFAL